MSQTTCFLMGPVLQVIAVWVKADPAQTETMRNGNKTKESDPRNENEWVEQDEPGVYITLTSLPGGLKDLKRVRFRYVASSFGLDFLDVIFLSLSFYVLYYVLKTCKN